MNFNAQKLPYKLTGSFSRMVLDYLDDEPALRDFYRFRPDISGIKKATEARKKIPVNRNLLVKTVQKKYAGLSLSDKLKANIDELISENTFTVCTAHQPNIFTGHLYFIYKILHAVKLCRELQAAMPENKFVPVYYMGSEDADLDELGEVTIKGKQYKWHTNQTGAVGRMKIDAAFIEIIEGITAQLSPEKFGSETMAAVKQCYRAGSTVEAATFHFVHYLFNDLGVVIVLPDDADLKKKFVKTVAKEVNEKFSQKAVNETIAAFPERYKIQSAGRAINLFYLTDGSRERIEETAEGFAVANTKLTFSKAALDDEIQNHPERFSPNVILRPVFQEMILPDIAFIGGGGELAYWLELKRVFESAGVFFPALVLRNSFTIINKTTSAGMHKLGFTTTDVFKTEKELADLLIKKESSLQLDLEDEKKSLQAVYEKIKTTAGAIDSTLCGHVYALRTQALNRLEVLEKKMLKAEKKKFDAQIRQIKKIKDHLYPGGSLQERTDNILEYLSQYGSGFIHALYEHSGGSQQLFTVITEQ